MIIMKANIFNCSKGKSDVNIDIQESVFSVKPNDDLIAQVYYVYRSNQRKFASHAKTRGEVAGGGRKPWKQKGTGRARHGSIRSPLWVGGGVTFAPKNVNWKRKINKKMVKLALKQVLSGRLNDGSLKFFEFGKFDYKKYRNCLNDLVKSSSTIVITDSKDVKLAVRNLEGVVVKRSDEFNIVDIVNSAAVIIDVTAINNIIERLS